MRVFHAVIVGLLVALTTSCDGHSTQAALFTPYVPVHPLDEGYFPQPKLFRQVETGLLQEHPIALQLSEPLPHLYNPLPDHVHHGHVQSVVRPEKPLLAFVAPSSGHPLVAYVPVQRGTPGAAWAVPNVFIKGQGYSTNQYVAPAVMQRYLAQDPR